MTNNATLGIEGKRKRGRPRAMPQVAQEQAAAYGISVPVLNETGDRFLSPNEIGKVMNVSGEAVKQWIYRRKLPAIRLANGFWKVRVADLEGFLKARTEVGRNHVLITDGGHSGIDEIVAAAEALNLRSIVAHNYPDALLKALDHFPSLFVICVAPHDPDCWKFAEKIRSNKSLRSFPILFVGGKAVSDADTEHAVEYNAKGLLLRPLSVDVVKNEIDRILKRSM
jgi:hypothetical protein